MSDLDRIQRDAQRQFDRQSERYGRGHILADTADIELALAHVLATGGRRALDVATGGGHTGLYLAAHGWDVTLADIAPGMLRQAGKLAAERGLQVQFAQHTAERLPHADGSFNLVACRVAAHHFSDPAAFICESARVLAPGGSLLLIDGAAPDNEPEAEAWIHSVEKLRDPSHHRFLTPCAWQELCGADGLNVVWTHVQPFKQPDLDWYFETAATPPDNRDAVLELIRTAPEHVREVFQLAEEDGRIVWWWLRLLLVATKPVRS
jgi:ubiquinone/menaquinone biosynthesis C-methylase UbiE